MTELHCPDDETVAGYVEDRLTPAARQLVEAHLAQCSTCLDVVAATLPSAFGAPQAASATERLATPARRMGARRGGQRAAIAAVLTLAATGVGGYAGGRWLMATMTARVDAAASAALGVPVRSSGLALRPRFDGTIGVRLSALRIGDRGSAKALEIGIPIAALFGGEATVHDAVLESAVLAVPVPGTLVPVAEPPLPSTDDAPPAGTFLLTVGDAPIHFTSVQLDPGGETMTAVANVGGGAFTVSGRLGTPSTPSDLRIQARDVALGALPARGVRLAGTARVDGTVTGPRGAEQVRLHIAADDGVIRGWNPLAPLLGTAPAAGSPSDLRFETLALDIAGPDGGWHVSELRGRLDGVDVAAAFHVAADGTLAGRGTATAGGRSIPFTIRGMAAAPVVAR